MNKIPTLFVRDPEHMARVTRDVTPGCEWVPAGEGIATRKWDGTNVRVTMRAGVVVAVEKRRNPTRAEKDAGAEPGYVPALVSDPSDKHILKAVDEGDTASWPDGSWSCEALGPKIQGGVEWLPYGLVAFSLPRFVRECSIPAPRDFDGLVSYLSANEIEGVVWHHPDGRMAKIKRRDFGLVWPVAR